MQSWACHQFGRLAIQHWRRPAWTPWRGLVREELRPLSQMGALVLTHPPTPRGADVDTHKPPHAVQLAGGPCGARAGVQGCAAGHDFMPRAGWGPLRRCVFRAGGVNWALEGVKEAGGVQLGRWRVTSSVVAAVRLPERAPTLVHMYADRCQVAIYDATNSTCERRAVLVSSAASSPSPRAAGSSRHSARPSPSMCRTSPPPLPHIPHN